MMNDVRWLLSRISSYGERPALIWGGEPISYSALHESVGRWLNELRARAVRPGERVAICGDYSPEACALLIAVCINRNIAVPLTRSADAQRSAFMEIANVGPVFTFDRGRLAEVCSRSTQEGESPLFAQLRERGSAGLLLFSSGSTGKSKAALLDFDRLLDRFRQPRRAYRTLAFLLMDHIGGINVLFQILCSGGTMVFVDDRCPRAVCQAIQEHGVELLTATPTFLNMLLMAGAYQAYDMSSLKIIAYGAEPMPKSTLGCLQRVFPNVELRQNYGLTELGVLQTTARGDGSLWVKLGGCGYEVKVVNNTLWIKSDSAMIGYLNAPSPFEEEGWFDTGDLVETDGEYVRILGRKSELINVGGEKVYPAEVESVLLEVDNIVDAVAAAKASPITGHVVVAKVFLRTPERREDLTRRVRLHCRDRLAPYKIPMSIEISETPLHGDRFKKARLQ